MRFLLLIAALAALPSCKTAGDIRQRQLTGQATSKRSVDEIAGCIALAISGKGAEIGTETIPNGRAVTWSIRVAGVKSVIEVYDVVDTGEKRTVSVFNVHKGGKPPTAISGSVADCI